MSDTIAKRSGQRVAEKKLEVRELPTHPEELTEDHAAMTHGGAIIVVTKGQAEKTPGGAGELAGWAHPGHRSHGLMSHGLISHRTG